MIGSAQQFVAFRLMFRKQVAAMTEPELQELDRRLEHLRDDVTLRRCYLRSITPLAIIRGQES